MAISHTLVVLSSIAVIFTAASVHAQGMPPEGPPLPGMLIDVHHHIIPLAESGGNPELTCH